MCEGVKKATCKEDPTGEVTIVENASCQLGYNISCDVITEGEGECKTTVTCEISDGPCNNTFVTCGEGYELHRRKRNLYCSSKRIMYRTWLV